MKFLFGLLGLYALVLYVGYALQEKMIFYPDKLSNHYDYGLVAPDAELNLTTEDGISINAIFLQGTSIQVDKSLVIYFHGNAGNLETWQEVAQSLRSFGTDVLMIDYRGYGKSSGKISSENDLYKDAEAAYAHARKKDYLDSQIVFYGRSIGTGVAMEMALRHPVKGLVLETPYTSLTRIAGSHYAFFLPWLILKYRLNNLDKAPEITIPTLMLHGTKDALIPLKHAEELNQAFSAPHRLVTIEGGNHNNLPQFPQHAKALKDFIFSPTTLK